MENLKPIPAFYCCYLLRSTRPKARSVYVGSTPNPVRRLKQHNGLTKGGAVRTRKDTLRPWEMACIVTGFPSKIAALQFEWAWQNPHLTRHIPAVERPPRAPARISPDSGKSKRPARPPSSLTGKIANLHALLRARSFERWPLKVKFFAKDAFGLWEKRSKEFYPTEMRTFAVELVACSTDERPGSKPSLPQERPGSKPSLPQDASQQDVGLNQRCYERIANLDVTYASLTMPLQKSRSLLQHASQCAVCEETISSDESLPVICPRNDCKMTAHMDCLAKRFLLEEQMSSEIIPRHGRCPSCSTKLEWLTLLKELSLRTRGPTELQNPQKKRATKAATSIATEGALVGSEYAVEDVTGEMEQSSDTESLDADFQTLESVLTGDASGFRLLSSCEVGASAVHENQIRPGLSPRNEHPHDFRGQGRPLEVPVGERVIPDSEWDDAEVLD